MEISAILLPLNKDLSFIDSLYNIPELKKQPLTHKIELKFYSNVKNKDSYSAVKMIKSEGIFKCKYILFYVTPDSNSLEDIDLIIEEV